MNAGFLEYSRHFEADCVVFHDVDMIPEDYRHFYTCHNSPRHLGAYVNKYDYLWVTTNTWQIWMVTPPEKEVLNGHPISSHHHLLWIPTVSPNILCILFFNYKLNAEVPVSIRPTILEIFAWYWLHRVFGFTGNGFPLYIQHWEKRRSQNRALWELFWKMVPFLVKKFTKTVSL